MEKFAAILLALIAGLSPARAADDSESGCIRIFDVKRGKSCGNPDSVDYRFENTCAHRIDAKVCAKLTNGTFSCGVIDNMKPGAKDQSYACKATGDIWWSARTAGSTQRFANP